ncbi:MAG: tetratricopeptide repeat protein [Deltaproteobacteria bacterium]|nr:tetratricopeptide repeat protein [Deltaproteobacteria bacterium]
MENLITTKPGLIARPLRALAAFPLLGLAFVLLAGCASQREVHVSALYHFQQGNQAFNKTDYATAIQQYSTAVSLDDQVAEFQYNLGLAYYQISETQKAVEAWLAAAALDGSHPDTHFNLALAYNKLYQQEEAHRQYNLYRKLVLTKPATFAPASLKTNGTSQMGGGADPASLPFRIPGQSQPPLGGGSAVSSKPAASGESDGATPPQGETPRLSAVPAPNKPRVSARRPPDESPSTEFPSASRARMKKPENSGPKANWWDKDLPTP